MTDPRAVLLALLESHTPADAKETADLERMRHFAHTLTAPFSRKQAEAHFTASAILISADLRSTGLVHHRKLNRWLQPGGHFEPEDNGSAEAAALREVVEETGCVARLVDGAPVPFDVDIHPIPAHKDEPAHLHLDVRLLVRATEDALSLNPAEAHNVQWLGWREALQRADDASLQRALRKAMRVLSV